VSPLLFGTGGSPHSTPLPKSIVEGVRRVAELGLDCTELEFVHGVRVSETQTRQIAAIAGNRGLRLSVHAPYYINLNSHDPEITKASQLRLYQAARAAFQCGAGDVAFHAAFYMGDPPEKVYEVVKQRLSEVLEDLDKDNIKVILRPELMGKISQFGALNEILRIADELPGVAPCIDWAHWHARTGVFNTYNEFATVLSQVKERLGDAALNDMHMHIAGIAYSPKGEREHLNLRESDFSYHELLQAFKDFKVGGLLICESPNLEDDALFLKKTYTQSM
jgi:deoxyribonuclease-4